MNEPDPNDPNDPTPSAEEFIESRKAAIAKRPWVKSKDVLRTGMHYHRIEAVTFHVQWNNPQKVMLIERLYWDRFVAKPPGGLPRRERVRGEISYRVGYWVVNRRGRWQWGQYSAMIQEPDFKALFDKARAEGTLLEDA